LLRLFAPAEVLALEIPGPLHEDVRRGVAALADITPLPPTSRSAVLQISRALLGPLHFTVRILGSPRTGELLLLLWNGSQPLAVSTP